MTSKGALDYMADRLALVDAAAAALKCRVDEVPARVENLQAELRETSNKLKKALTGGSSDAISSAIDGAVEPRRCAPPAPTTPSRPVSTPAT